MWNNLDTKCKYIMGKICREGFIGDDGPCPFRTSEFSLVMDACFILEQINCLIGQNAWTSLIIHITDTACIDQQVVSDWELFPELTECPITLQSVCDWELMISSSSRIALA